jgi:formiminotetrahydrofolate cyclodeaminase
MTAHSTRDGGGVAAPLDRLADESLGTVVAAMSSREPLPAAGAALAVTLAMAAALLAKAASATRHGAAVDSAACSRARRIGAEALALADEDAATYRRVLAAEADGATLERMRAALSDAAEPPLAMAKIALELSQIAEPLVPRVPVSLRGEVRTAAHLARAGAAAAAQLVAIDISSSRDARVRHAADIAAEVATIVGECTAHPL